MSIKLVVVVSVVMLILGIIAWLYWMPTFRKITRKAKGDSPIGNGQGRKARSRWRWVLGFLLVIAATLFAGYRLHWVDATKKMVGDFKHSTPTTVVAPPSAPAPKSPVPTVVPSPAAPVAASVQEPVPDKAAEKSKPLSSVQKHDTKPHATRLKSTVSEGAFVWRHFGADPYASSKDEGMAKRKEAFVCLGLPQPVIDLLMKETEKPGKTMRVTVGDHLEAMLSKGCAVHKNVTVAFGSPAKGVEYAAPAESWQVTWEGKVYTVARPDVCNNWSIVSIVPVGAPKPPQEAKAACVTIQYPTIEGDQVHVGVLGSKPLPPSSCFALQTAGETEFVTPPVRCPEGPCTFDDVVADVGSSLQHSFGYEAKAGENMVRLPAIVTDPAAGYVVVLCVVHKMGPPSCGMDVRATDYVSGVARIYQDEAAAKAAGAKDRDGKPGRLWWRYEHCYPQ